MDESSRMALAVASRVLSYPTDRAAEELATVLEAIETDLEDNEPLRRQLRAAVEPLRHMPLREWRERYVETFDLKEKAGLYLTAQELGDSRKRGMELIALQTLIQESGFMYRMDELADYIPMLYEFLAAAEENEETERLKIRLALATARIHRFLPEDALFKPVFSALLDAVFEPPSAEELEKLEQSREKPDLDPMPYPLMYK